VVLIVYLLCEDSSSGFEFWKEFIHTFFDNDSNIQVVSAYGKNNILSKFKSLDVQKNDILFLLFDNIGTTEIAGILNIIRPALERKGCHGYFSAYYCFEEIFLSYTNLEMLCDCQEPVIIRYLNQIRECLKEGKNWYESLDIEGIKRYVEKKIAENPWRKKNVGANFNNREQMASWLLGFITNKVQVSKKGISKKNLGDCWIKDCSAIRKEFSMKFCQRCIWEPMALSGREKYADLNEKSLFSYTGSHDLMQMAGIIENEIHMLRY